MTSYSSWSPPRAPRDHGCTFFAYGQIREGCVRRRLSRELAAGTLSIFPPQIAPAARERSGPAAGQRPIEDTSVARTLPHRGRGYSER
jgi:hypothetical protein